MQIPADNLSRAFAVGNWSRFGFVFAADEEAASLNSSANRFFIGNLDFRTPAGFDWPANLSWNDSFSDEWANERTVIKSYPQLIEVSNLRVRVGYKAKWFVLLS